MRFQPTDVPPATVIELDRFTDDRGWFARGFCAREFADNGLNSTTAQTNLSFNGQRGTLRGLHFQHAPHQESKLVRCLRGAIYDVAVDLRPESPTHLQWVGFELTEDNGRALYVPDGFAHGFLTLTDDVLLSYQASEFYAPGSEGGLRYDDPAIGIDWPGEVEIISDKDAAWPLLEVAR